MFKIDIETCDHCGGAVKVIASIEDPAVIKQILAHLERRAAPATLRLQTLRACPAATRNTGPPGTRLTVLNLFSRKDAKLGTRAWGHSR